MKRGRKKYPVTADELFDRYSEYVGDDIDSLQQVAGLSVMKREDFQRLYDDHFNFIPISSKRRRKKGTK